MDNDFWRIIAIAVCAVLCALCALIVRLLGNILTLVTNETKQAVIGVAINGTQIKALQDDVSELRQRINS